MSSLAGPALSVGGLADVLATRRKAGRQVEIFGIGGFPLTGKTTLAHAIATKIGTAQVLPTESFISSRAARRGLNVDGCSAAAHDLEGLCRAICALRSGERIEIPGYSWSSGQHDSSIVLGPMTTGGAVLVDGSAACTEPVAQLCDHLIFVVPAAHIPWMRAAVERDVQIRSWGSEAAAQQNIMKAHTVLQQWRACTSFVDVVVLAQAEVGETPTLSFAITSAADAEETITRLASAMP